jgi:hypothetical protein
MLYRTLAYAAAGVMLAITQAGATTYTYTGNESNAGDGHQYYVSATVDLNCVGPCSGTYADGSGLTSFTLSIDNSSNVPIYSISSSDPEYLNDSGGTNYLTLSNAGAVTNWLLYANLSSDPISDPNPLLNPNNLLIYTIGYDLTLNAPDISTQDLYTFGPYEGSGTLNPNPGSWSPSADISATPLPSTWTMLIAGFVGLGFFASRGSKKNSAALAA